MTGGGKLPPKVLTAFILYMVADGNRRGIRHLLPDFWEDCQEHGYTLPSLEPASPSAVCQARQNLNPELFRGLLMSLADTHKTCRKGQSSGLWRKGRVLAIDGAKINLRRSPDLKLAFGTPKGAHCPQALMSTLVDVKARMPLDFEVSGFKGSERQHLLLLLDSVHPGDLLILDRGYPSHEVLQECCDVGVDFLIRVPKSHTFGAVQKFAESGCSDQRATITPPANSPDRWLPVDVRLTRIEGPEGSAFYISSLDMEEFKVQDIGDLYHERWEVEEYFKLFSSEYAGQKQCRSTSEAGVRQEIGAFTLFLAISRLLAESATEAIEESDEFASQKGAVLIMARYLCRILLAPNPEAAERHSLRAVNRASAIRDRIRPGRSSPRRSFKPSPKWTPTGRWGA